MKGHQPSLFMISYSPDAFLPKNLSTAMAMAPSPVTLQAVPKLSMAMYSAIINACASSSKPRMLDRGARAAMMAPPGTPGPPP